jgi:steroid delta-isomerase-like uncharacterized protein
MTSVQDNKTLVRRFIDEIFVQGRTEAVDELLADDFVGHTWPSTGHPKDDLKAAIGRTAKGLSDPRFVVEDMIAEGDQVAVRLTAEATQTGELMGMPASGKRYSIGEIHIFRVRDGKVTEHWHQFDQVSMMRQLGALPAAGPKAGPAASREPAPDSESAPDREPAAAR